MIEGGAVLLDVIGLSYAPLEPASFLMEDRHLVFRELVLVLLEMLTDVRRGVLVLSKAAVKRPSRFPHIVGITVVTLYMIHHSAFVLFLHLVLRMNKAAPDGVGGSEMHRNPSFAYAPS